MTEAPVATVLDATVATPTRGTPRLGIRGTGELRTMTAHVTFATPAHASGLSPVEDVALAWLLALEVAESLVGIARR